MSSGLVLTLSCPDQPGIVFRVAELLAAHGLNITESQQFLDPPSGDFSMRVEIDRSGSSVTVDELRRDMAVVAEPLAMVWAVEEHPRLVPTMILVSKLGHCLNDLLYRQRSGGLSIEVPLVVSNHPDLAPMAEFYDVPFVHLPVEPGTKVEAEAELRRLADERGVELVVLARYMQVLSPELCAHWEGRAINIHHSFLPGFKGARPYHQAYLRGVKLIGATAHYVTAELDEGPIIEQEVARVDHGRDPAALAAIGRDLECVALARAVRWHTERRIVRSGARTIVFS